MATTKKSQSLPDLLKLEGVIAKGYGLITQSIMSDASLSNYAKAILLYLCSLSGRGEIFPGRDRIIADLGISKNTYYAGIKELITKGYIKVKQIRDTGKFSRNVYTIPTSVTIDGGYGIIPYTIMVDDRLSHNEKVIYGYISSYSGSQNNATLKPTIMQFHLNIGKTLRHNAIKKLRDLNYIDTTRIHSNGVFTDLVTYSIIPNPDETNSVKSARASVLTISAPDSCKDTADKDTVDQDTANKDTANQDTANKDTVDQDTADKDTVDQDTADKDTVNKDTVNKDTAHKYTTNNRSLPVTDSTIISIVPALSGQMVAAITKKIDFEKLLTIYSHEPKTLRAIGLLMEFVKEVYCDPQPMYKLHKEIVTEHYLRFLLDHYDLRESASHAIEAFRSNANSVINCKAFMSACFLNHLHTMTELFQPDEDLVLGMQLRFGNAEYYGDPKYADRYKTC